SAGGILNCAMIGIRPFQVTRPSIVPAAVASKRLPVDSIGFDSSRGEDGIGSLHPTTSTSRRAILLMDGHPWQKEAPQGKRHDILSGNPPWRGRQQCPPRHPATWSDGPKTR